MFYDHISLIVHKQLLSTSSALRRTSSSLVFESEVAVLFQKMWKHRKSVYILVTAF